MSDSQMPVVMKVDIDLQVDVPHEGEKPPAPRIYVVEQADDDTTHSGDPYTSS